MIRIVIENVLLFLLPTLMYLGYMYIVRRGQPNQSQTFDDAPLLWLFGAGVLLMVIVLLAFGDTSGSGRPDQAYEPPSYKDGVLQPGRIR